MENRENMQGTGDTEGIADTAQEEKADTLIMEMTSAYLNGTSFKDLKGISNEDMDAIYGVAFSLYNAGKFDKALTIFQFLCFFDHYDTKYWVGFGATQQMLKDYESAIRAYAMAAVLNTQDPKPSVYIADCFLATGNKEAAENALESVIALAGDQEKYQADAKRAAALLKLIKNKK